MSGRFGIDCGELEDIVADLDRTRAALAQLTDDVDREVAALHEAWTGAARLAHAAAQAEWRVGLVAMREAVADLRAAASLAHENYTGAVTANVTMWESMS